jgi:LysM repeat protein
MKAYKYKKPEKINRNKVNFRSYTQKASFLSSLIFSKPVFLTTTTFLFVLSNYFIVSTFSQVSKADNTDQFKLYSVNQNQQKSKTMNFIVNPIKADEIKYDLYEVVSGDNLSIISQKSGDSIAEILLNNKLGDNSILRVGQRLKVVRK